MPLRDASDQIRLGEFVRDLAHDIANPLNALTMSAEVMRLLLDRGDIAGARATLERLLSECARCGRLVQGFQSFGAALQANGHEPVAAQELLRSAAEMMRDAMPDTEPTVQIAGAGDTIVQVDRQAMQHAFAALFRNAAEAGASTVSTTVSSAGTRARIAITDDGSGIEQRWLVRVTEPFFTTRRAQGAGGLGLTLAREIIQRHEGTLTIQSDGAHGTSVIVDLPIDETA
jgi:signal transduction histidine kinase